MADLVERLRLPSYWKSSDGYSEAYDRAPFDAADELERLRASPLTTEREAVARIIHRRFYAVVNGHDDCAEWPDLTAEMRGMYLEGAGEILAALIAGPVSEGERA